MGLPINKQRPTGHTKTIVTIVKTMMVLDCSPDEIASLRLTRASSTFACCCLRFKRSLSYKEVNRGPIHIRELVIEHLTVS